MSDFLLGFVVIVLMVTLVACGVLGDTIVAPADEELSVTRGSTDISLLPLTLTYTVSDASNRDITVSASVGIGTPVADAKLSIQGGDLGTAGWTLLIEGSASAGSVTLKSLIVEDGSITDIKFQLDATNVNAGAGNLGTQWTYTVTYTIALTL